MGSPLSGLLLVRASGTVTDGYLGGVAIMIVTGEALPELPYISPIRCEKSAADASLNSLPAEIFQARPDRSVDLPTRRLRSEADARGRHLTLLAQRGADAAALLLEPVLRFFVLEDPMFRQNFLSAVCTAVSAVIIAVAASQYVVRPVYAFDPSRDHSCVNNCPSPGGNWVPPPPVEQPNVTKARNVYNEANDAYNSKDFARAARLYYDAYNLDGKIEYLNSHKQALAREYDALGDRAWHERDWAAAIKHYKQALSTYHFDYIEENLKRARANLSDDQAGRYYEDQNYDLAILYWEQAYRIWPDPRILENIKKAKFAKAVIKSKQALTEGRFADLEAAALEILKRDPTSAYAVEMLASAARLRAEARLKEGKDGFDDALKGYQRAIAAVAEFARRGGKGEMERMQQFRDTAVAVLAKLAHKSRNINDLVRSYESWGGESKTALQIISGELGIALVGPASPPAPILALPPAEPVPAGAAIATAIDEATRLTSQPVTAAGPRTVAAPSVVAPDRPDCFEQPHCPNPSIRFIPSDHYVPAELETPPMKQLHREIDEISRSIDRVTKSLQVAERTNSFRAPALEQERESLNSQRSEKKQEYDNIVRTMKLD
jgi:hypothetical protein